MDGGATPGAGPACLVLDAESFDLFERRLNEPGVVEPALLVLLRRTAPWEASGDTLNGVAGRTPASAIEQVLRQVPVIDPPVAKARR